MRQIRIQLCGCLDPLQIYVGATKVTYTPPKPLLSNCLLIYQYLGQLNLHADLQQKSASDLFTHKFYGQICSQLFHTQILNKNPQLI